MYVTGKKEASRCYEVDQGQQLIRIALELQLVNCISHITLQLESPTYELELYIYIHIYLGY